MPFLFFILTESVIFYFTFLRRGQSRWRISSKLSFEGSTNGPISCCAHLFLCIPQWFLNREFPLGSQRLAMLTNQDEGRVLLGVFYTRMRQKDTVRLQARSQDILSGSSVCFPVVTSGALEQWGGGASRGALDPWCLLPALLHHWCYWGRILVFAPHSPCIQRMCGNCSQKNLPNLIRQML